MERLFHSLSRTSDGAFIIDRHNRIIFWNQAAEEILEYSAEEAAGRQCYEILGGLDEQGRTLCQRFCRLAIQADKGDILPNTDVYTHTRTGEGRWLNLTTFVYPAGDTADDPVLVHLFRDATEKKEYQRFVDSVLAASDQLQKDDGHRINPVAAGPQTGGLTAREQQVLALLAQGLGTDEMARTLVVSPTTVRNHVQNILNKLGVHSRLEAVAHAYQQGLIDTNNK